MIESKYWDKTANGEEVYLFTIFNSTGSSVCLSNYGARIISALLPDLNGVLGDVVPGYDTLAEYENDRCYLNCSIGRYANRIDPQLMIDGVEYQLPINDHKVNTLHGGKNGFDKHVWAYEIIGDNSIRFTYHSPHLDEGFPGEMDVSASFTFSDDNTLTVLYDACCSETTVVNLTLHSYFNLDGETSNTILDHDIFIAADRYLPVNKALQPLGHIAPVKDTPFDFQTKKRIRTDFSVPDEQLQNAGGYDHCYVLSDEVVDTGKPAVILTGCRSGRRLTISTSQPGLQFYSGNFFGPVKGKGGRQYEHYGFLALEAQHYPYSPNHPEYPSTILKKGELYHHTINYHFDTV